MLVASGYNRDGERVILLALTSDDTERLIDGEAIEMPAGLGRDMPDSYWPSIRILYQNLVQEATNRLVDICAKEGLQVGAINEVH